jgi:hypothetical protein
MTTLERLGLQLCACALLVLAAWAWHAGEVDDAYEAGQAAAVEAGRVRYEAEVARALKTESNYRALLKLKDDLSHERETVYAENLSAAQRRAAAGTDRLRCPGAGAISNAAATPVGPAAGGSGVDGGGAELVPAVAVDILGLAADTGRLVRKYDRLTQRFEECRALNNGAASAGQ